MRQNEIRDWINTITQILLVIIAIVALIIGNSHLSHINISLENIKTNNLLTNNITVIEKLCFDPQCRVYTMYNGSNRIDAG